MYLEIATIQGKAGDETRFEAAAATALEAFRNAHGCDGAQIRKNVEASSRNLLVVKWHTLFAHLKDLWIWKPASGTGAVWRQRFMTASRRSNIPFPSWTVSISREGHDGRHISGSAWQV